MRSNLVLNQKVIYLFSFQASYNLVIFQDGVHLAIGLRAVVGVAFALATADSVTVRCTIAVIALLLHRAARRDFTNRQ